MFLGTGAMAGVFAWPVLKYCYVWTHAPPCRNAAAKAPIKSRPLEREKGQRDVQMKQQDAQMNQVSHAMELDNQQQSHEQALTEQREMSNAKTMAVRQGNKGDDSRRSMD